MMNVLTLIVIALLPFQAIALGVQSLRSSSYKVSTGSSSRTLLHANQQNQEDEESTKKTAPADDLNPIAKASWYAVESFGNIFAPLLGDGAKETSASATLPKQIDFSKAPSSLQETIQRIEIDNKRFYFLSGEVDKLCYDENCVFSDPFVAFSGRDRFVNNLQNLGSFVTEYDVKEISNNVSMEENQVDMKVMVKLELNLPWKPILAWPWGVKYDIDPETYLITNHEESWDIAPLEGVKQIFRKPTLKIQKSQD